MLQEFQRRNMLWCKGTHVHQSQDMPPRTDVTRPRVCKDCETEKPPDEYSRINVRPDGSYGLRTYCKDCENARKRATTAAIAEQMLASLPQNGTKRTANDFLVDMWTVTEGRLREPRRQSYVKLSEIHPTIINSPEFVNSAIKARVDNLQERLAHATPSSRDQFVPLDRCLQAIGLRLCTQCHRTKPRDQFALADRRTGQLRGECRECK